MPLNHAHLAGADVAALEAFYSAWFGFRRKPGAEDDGITFLVDDSGFLLAIDEEAGPAVLPDWFHLGFCHASPEPVRELFGRMKAAGVKFTRELKEWPGEAAVFFCLDPAGAKIEVSWHAT
jgi:catechol 2,3-dioxygenase-like lactoylglutathione lyase family enzyme